MFSMSKKIIRAIAMQDWITRIAFDNASPLVTQASEHKFGFQVHQPEIMAHSHWHGHVEINYLFDCSADYLINGHKISVPEGKMIIFWASIPHQMIASQGDGYMVNVYIPLQAFQSWKFPSEFVGLLLRGEVLVSDKLHLSDYELTRQWEQDLTRGDPALTAQVVSEIRLPHPANVGGEIHPFWPGRAGGAPRAQKPGLGAVPHRYHAQVHR